MSFSSEVKGELCRQTGSARHCQIAEAAAILRMCGQVDFDGGYRIRVRTENRSVSKKFSLLIRKCFGISPEVNVKGGAYALSINEDPDARRILEAMKLMDSDGRYNDRADLVSNMVITNSCCKRAFMRGAFLAGGSMSDPERSYHFEIVCSGREKAEQLARIAASFDIGARVAQRKHYYVFYIKDGDEVASMLGLMGAGQALMSLENARIVREMRGSINRKVNCEVANSQKTVTAAMEQISDIEYIRDHAGLKSLSDGLFEIATARLDHPEATLRELGDSLSPPVGKSGVNHRMRKIKQLAETLREFEEEQQ